MKFISTFFLTLVSTFLSISNAAVGNRECTVAEAAFEAEAYLKLKMNTYNVIISSAHGADYQHGIPTKMEFIFTAIPKDPEVANYGVRIGTLTIKTKEDGTCTLPDHYDESADFVHTDESYNFGDYLKELKKGPQ